MTETTNPEPSDGGVRWLQVACLAAVQGAITLSWIAYALYLPRFIEQVFVYPTAKAQQFAALLLLIESAIAVAVEPLFGSLSDRWQRWYSSNMPLVMAGAFAAIVIFMAIPLAVALGGAAPVMQVVLPGLAVLWAVAMATFRSPVLSLLGRFAKAPQLPLAASLLTLVGGCIGAVKPLASDAIVALGAFAAFAMASFGLLAGVVALRLAMNRMPAKPAGKNAATDSEKNAPLTAWQLGLDLVVVVLAGVMLGLAMRVLNSEVVPRTLKAEIVALTGLALPVLSGALLIAQGFVALATGACSKWLDNKHLMLLALAGMVLCLAVLALASPGAVAALLTLVALVVCMTAVSNGMVAFALTMAPPLRSGLAVGLFFAGVSAVNAAFGYVLPQPAELALPQVLLLATLACVGAGAAIGLGRYLRAQQT